MITTGTITKTINEGVATLTFFHPASNSFPSTLLQQLTSELKLLAQDSSAKVIVLQSEGQGAFCAGASFDELLNIETPEAGDDFFSGFAHVINAMRACPQIIVGRIHGKAVGGGVGLASACDYAMAAQNSSIKLSEIAIGIGPFVIEPAVSRKIGKMAMTEMTLMPEQWKSAAWAQEKGLYAQIFETQEELNEAVMAFAKKLASYNPEALAEMKKVMWEGTEDWPTLLFERAKISGKLVLSDFTKNALNQFKNK